MGGGLMQIVANGAHDVYLTGNPQITFFKAVYRRHTNFSIESVKQIFNGKADFGEDVSCTISRNADLISRAYFQTTLPEVDISYGINAGDNTKYKAFRWLNYIGHILIDWVKITIGGQDIDTHYGEWLHIWNELSQHPGKQIGYSEMVGNVPKLTQIYNSNTDTSCKTDEYTLYIPLQFWFCKNPGMALPLIALQHTDIVITLRIKELDKCIWATEQIISSTASISDYKPVNQGADVINTTTTQLKSSNIYVDYIYLDTDERRRFAQVPHEYLIEQLKYSGPDSLSSVNENVKLNFTHPVKELIWVVQPTNFTKKDYTQSRGGRQYFNYSDLWDYSGFTGTPENNFGVGMIGGKSNQNLLLGLSPVKVEGELNINNKWAKTKDESINRETAGYNNVQNYTNINSSSKPNTRKGLWSLLTNTNLMDNGINPIKNAQIKLNGNDRFSKREGKYFNVVQPYQHHTNCPAVGINVYSFSITPEEHQPSGTCNFSRIDNASLEIELSTNTLNNVYNSASAQIRIYAIHYNILRIMSGMAGLAYSN